MAKSGNSHSRVSVLSFCRTLSCAAWFIPLFTLAACSGGGGGSDPAPVPTAVVTPPPANASTPTDISGKATYQMVPHDRFTNGLVYQFTFSKPIREAVVELVSASGATLATTTTDEEGNYQFSTDSGQSVSVRVKAQMALSGSPSWDVTVVDNVSNDALYALGSETFTTSGVSMVQNLEAGSGWTGLAYTQVRAAGPFAVMDVVYDSMQKVIEVDPDINFPPLELNWSVDNRPTSGSFADGEIGSSLFRPSGGGREIFIVGAQNTDTDEYDPHVIAHEFTHYLHYHFGRSDSLGGSHSVGDRLDPRVAFGEGVATAFAAIILEDSNYVDTLGFNQASGVNRDIEDNDLRNKGWYNEGSVQAIIYDLYDEQADDADSLALGFDPLYDALTGQLRNDVAFVTIHAYLNALKNDHPAIENMVDNLAAMQAVNTAGSDAYGRGESNSASRFDQVLPIYTELPVDGTVVRLCTIAGNTEFGTRNKLGNRRFIKLSVFNTDPNQATLITATGPAGTDPDLVLHQDGIVQSSLNATDGQEVLRRFFTEGDYVLEVYEYANTTDDPFGNVCFDIQATIQ